MPYSMDNETPPDPAAYAAMIAQLTKGLERSADFRAGAADRGQCRDPGVASDLREGRAKARGSLILDAGMNDLMRPALYDAHHEIVPVAEAAAGRPPPSVTMWSGPICETADMFRGATATCRG